MIGHSRKEQKILVGCAVNLPASCELYPLFSTTPTLITSWKRFFIFQVGKTVVELMKDNCFDVLDVELFQKIFKTPY